MTNRTDSEVGTMALHGKIRDLQKEIYSLNKIIELKNSALEELNKLFLTEIGLSKQNVEPVISICRLV
jgi:hypothetical protein